MNELNAIAEALWSALSYFPSRDTMMIATFIVVQALYTLTFAVDIYIFSLPVNWVDMERSIDLTPGNKEDYPFIVLFYPVLRELKVTMQTTFASLSKIEYPKGRYKVVAIPNANDTETMNSLKELQQEFPFVELLPVPPTTDPKWQGVWDAWDECKTAYWWTNGPEKGNRNLPPKKTRQLIFAFYSVWKTMHEPFLVNYIDADSCPPPDHFIAAAIGIGKQGFDVLQSQNVAGNLNENLAATGCAMDHMSWDGSKYVHLSSGKQPYWVLGKGLFFKSEDLVALGGFHPWITIEDPEVGLRFWKHGKRLAIIRGSLIEEVPNTFAKAIIQRKRWVAGFFQSLDVPLKEMNFTFTEKVKAWCIFYPCLSMSINAVGIPSSAWALWKYLHGTGILPLWIFYVSMMNVAMFCIALLFLYKSTWVRTGLVLKSVPERVWYILKVNPICLMLWWLWWLIPLIIGYDMYRKNKGLEWERTEKLDKNRLLIFRKLKQLEYKPEKKLAA